MLLYYQCAVGFRDVKTFKYDPVHSTKYWGSSLNVFHLFSPYSILCPTNNDPVQCLSTAALQTQEAKPKGLGSGSGCAASSFSCLKKEKNSVPVKYREIWKAATDCNDQLQELCYVLCIKCHAVLSVCRVQ